MLWCAGPERWPYAFIGEKWVDWGGKATCGMGGVGLVIWGEAAQVELADVELRIEAASL